MKRSRPSSNANMQDEEKEMQEDRPQDVVAAPNQKSTNNETVFSLVALFS